MVGDLLHMPVRIGGVELKNPFIVASGPIAKMVDQFEQAERAGWAAISIKQTFNPYPPISYEPRYRWLKKEGFHIGAAEYRLGLEQGLRLVETARKRSRDIIIIANYSCVNPDLHDWQETARRFEEAGAQMLELNLGCPNTSFNLGGGSEHHLCDAPSSKKPVSSGASMGQDEDAVRLVVEETRKATDLPIITKLTPEGDRIAEVSRVAFEAGADAVCDMANRLGVPPIDVWDYHKPIYRLQGQHTLGALSGPWVKPLALRDVLEIRKTVGPDRMIIGTGGISSWEDAVQMMMCGADAIGVCTHVMLKGYGFLEKWLIQLKEYMSRMGFRNLIDIRDLLIKEFRPTSEITILPGYAKVDLEKCSSCGLCAKVGHCNAIELKEPGACFDNALCTGCSTCVDICPTGAISIVEKS